MKMQSKSKQLACWITFVFVSGCSTVDGPSKSGASQLSIVQQEEIIQTANADITVLRGSSENLARLCGERYQEDEDGLRTCKALYGDVVAGGNGFWDAYIFNYEASAESEAIPVSLKTIADNTSESYEKLRKHTLNPAEQAQSDVGTFLVIVDVGVKLYKIWKGVRAYDRQQVLSRVKGAVDRMRFREWDDVLVPAA